MKRDFLTASLIWCALAISPAALGAVASDESPGPAEEMTNPSKAADERAACLRGASASGRELKSVKPRRLKKEAGQRPGSVV